MSASVLLSLFFSAGGPCVYSILLSNIRSFFCCFTYYMFVYLYTFLWMRCFLRLTLISACGYPSTLSVMITSANLLSLIFVYSPHKFLSMSICFLLLIMQLSCKYTVDFIVVVTQSTRVVPSIARLVVVISSIQYGRCTYRNYLHHSLFK